MIRRMFFVFIFPIFLFTLFFPSFAVENEQTLGDSDIISDIMNLVDQAVSDFSVDDVVDGEASADFVDFVDDENSDPEIISSNIVPNNNLLVVNSPTYTPSDLAQAVYEAIAEIELQRIDEYAEITDMQIMPLYSVDNGQTDIPSNSLRAVLNNVIGPYSPVVVQYQYQNGQNVGYLREILPDYQWMISAAIFALVLYCVFRLWGVVLCKR